MNDEDDDPRDPADPLSAEERKLVNNARYALQSMPIMARLQFAKKLVLDRVNADGNATTTLAFEVLGDALDLLEKFPEVAYRWKPELGPTFPLDRARANFAKEPREPD